MKNTHTEKGVLAVACGSTLLCCIIAKQVYARNWGRGEAMGRVRDGGWGKSF